MNNPNELLAALVKALDGAFISSWQSTAAWQKELNAARSYIERLDTNEDHSFEGWWSSQPSGMQNPASKFAAKRGWAARLMDSIGEGSGGCMP